MTKDEAKQLGFKQYKDTRYYVNAQGVILSFANTDADRFERSTKSKILNHQQNGYGTPCIKFKHNGKYSEKTLKHMMFVSFFGYEPRKIINIDGNAKNVNISNLRDADATE